MPVLQTVYKSGAKGSALGKRLVAGANQPAPHVLKSTIEYNREGDESVVLCRSRDLGMLAGVLVKPGQQFWLIKSRVADDRFYVLVRNSVTGAWMCSSKEEKTVALCIKKVEKYIADWKARKSEKAA